MVDILLVFVINAFSLYMAVQYYRVLKKERQSQEDVRTGRVSRRAILMLTGYFLLWGILNLCCLLLNRQDNELADIICAVCVIMILGCETMLAFQKEREWKEYNSRRDLMRSRQLQYYARQYEALSRFNESMRRERHEKKNRNLTLLAMARDSDLDGIRRLLEEEQESLQRREMQVYTGNMAIDAVLGYECTVAWEKGIRTQLEVCVPREMDVPASVLCGILGNALDNATEACALLPAEERRIAVFLKVEKKNLFLEIKNPYDGTLVLREDGHLATRKEDGEGHGQGLGIIRELAERVGGTVDTAWDGSEFCLRVILFHVL